MNTSFKTSRFILDFFRRHIGLSIFFLIVIIGASTTTLLPPILLRYLLDSLATNTSYATASLTGWSLGYFGSYFLVGIFIFLEDWMIDSVGQKLIHHLRRQMMEKSYRLRASYYSRHGVGEMTSRITDDVYAIELLFTDGLISMAVSLFQIIGIFVTVFVFDWVLGLLLLGILPVVAVITAVMRRSMLRRQVSNRKILNAESNDIAESVDNIGTIHNLGKESYRESYFHELLGKGYAAMNTTAIFDAVYSPIIEMLKTLLIALVTYLVAQAFQGSTFFVMADIGTYASVLTLISNVFSPIQDIGQELESMQEGVSGIKRVEAYMNEPEVPETDSSIVAEEMRKDTTSPILTLDHLSFHYDDGEEMVLDDVSYTLKPLEKVTVLGRTGAGKTTLFKLIAGIVEPTSGKLLIQGKETYRIPNDQKRRLFGYVEQGFHAIEGTIAEQITLKDSSYSEADIENVLKEVFLFYYITTRIPGGLSAPFREEDFSRGQLQLLTVARALISDPTILLLDEISANLDSETEKEIIEALAKASDNRTVISISHRLSDSLGFTKKLHVDGGKLIEETQP